MIFALCACGSSAQQTTPSAAAQTSQEPAATEPAAAGGKYVVEDLTDKAVFTESTCDFTLDYAKTGTPVSAALVRYAAENGLVPFALALWSEVNNGGTNLNTGDYLYLKEDKQALDAFVLADLDPGDDGCDFIISALSKEGEPVTLVMHAAIKDGAPEAKEWGPEGFEEYSGWGERNIYYTGTFESISDDGVVTIGGTEYTVGENLALAPKA
jgi:hypothetical protein